MATETERLDQTIKEILVVARCGKEGHRGIEYVCTACEGLCDRLVCIDCLRTDPSHFAAHSKEFVPLEKFLRELASEPEDIDVVRKVRENVRQLKEKTIHAQDVMIKDLKVALLKIEDKFTEVIHLAMEEISQKLEEVLKSACQTSITSLTKLFESMNDVSSLGTKNLIEEILHFFESQSHADLRRRLNKIAPLCTPQSLINKIVAMQSSIISLDAKSLIPQVNFSLLQARTLSISPQLQSLISTLPPIPNSSLLLPCKGQLSIPSLSISFTANNNNHHQHQQYSYNNNTSFTSQLTTPRKMIVSQPPLDSFLMMPNKPPLEHRHRRLDDIDRRIEEIFKEPSHTVNNTLDETGLSFRGLHPDPSETTLFQEFIKASPRPSPKPITSGSIQNTPKPNFSTVSTHQPDTSISLGAHLDSLALKELSLNTGSRVYRLDQHILHRDTSSPAMRELRSTTMVSQLNWQIDQQIGPVQVVRESDRTGGIERAMRDLHSHFTHQPMKIDNPNTEDSTEVIRLGEFESQGGSSLGAQSQL